MAHRSLASFMGWLSFACWLFVYSPQIYENYANQSGEGLSIFFVLIWMIGDIANLFGSWKQNLLPTMIGLALYYTLCDLILLFQIFYYRRKTNTIPIVETAAGPTETDPLLSINTELRNAISTETMSCPPTKTWRAQLATYVAAYASICIIGLIGWGVSEGRLGFHRSPKGPADNPIELWDTTAQLVGWISAGAYIGSRIPQIFKNRQTKCRGLSMLFFLVGITGNLTYVASILFAGLDPTHIWINLSWLFGSGGTVLLDLIVLYQFWFYRRKRLDICIPVPQT